VNTTTSRHPVMTARMVVSAGTGIIATLVTVFLGNWRYAPSLGWVAGAAVFCTWTWVEIWPLPPGQTAAHATGEDPNRALREVIVLGASVASLGAVGLLLVYAHQEAGLSRAMLALLALVSVAVSWFSVHTIFMLRYARLYYAEPAGGIDFNQAEPPGYRDFAYLALTLGMTYQVSDTNLRNSAVRSTALQHALLSYLFGSIILAAAINLVVSLGTTGG
jgi:uncharacterized membrane protein